MFTEVLFTIAKTWKQARCPSVNKWKENVTCVCVCVCVQNIQWNIIQMETLPSATTGMNPEGITPTPKRNKSDRERQILSDRFHLYMDSKNKLTDKENTLVLSKGQGQLPKWVNAVKRYKLLAIKKRKEKNSFPYLDPDGSNNMRLRSQSCLRFCI